MSDINIISLSHVWNGCLFQIRLASNVSDDVDEDPTGNKALWDRGLLNGASQKADIAASFHIGETCMSLQVSRTRRGGHLGGARQ